MFQKGRGGIISTIRRAMTAAIVAVFVFTLMPNVAQASPATRAASISAPSMRMPAKDKTCLFGGKLWAQNSFGANRTVWYARNWTANPDRQPTYAGITFMRGFTSNGGTRNRDDSSRPVRLSLQRGQKSPGFDCRVPWKDYPSYVDVDGFYVPAGWWVRIETLHLRGTNTWRYWRNLPGGKTGRWYKVNGPSSALGGKYKLAWAWIGGNQPS